MAEGLLTIVQVTKSVCMWALFLDFLLEYSLEKMRLSSCDLIHGLEIPTVNTDTDKKNKCRYSHVVKDEVNEYGNIWKKNC